MIRRNPLMGTQFFTQIKSNNINEGDLIEFLLGDRDRLAETYEDVLKLRIRNPIYRFILKSLLK